MPRVHLDELGQQRSCLPAGPRGPEGVGDERRRAAEGCIHDAVRDDVALADAAGQHHQEHYIARDGDREHRIVDPEHRVSRPDAREDEQHQRRVSRVKGCSGEGCQGSPEDGPATRPTPRANVSWKSGLSTMSAVRVTQYPRGSENA